MLTPTTAQTQTLASSQEIRDRGSTFVGCVYRAKSVEEARAALRRYAGEDLEGRRPHAHAAGGSDSGGDRGVAEDKGPYVMGAWRCMALRPGRTGLGGPDDFVVQDGCEDGGERYAGERVLGVMRREGVLDAVVVVRRWFGGTLLGPIRFTHIETCAGEVCRRFRKIEEMDECVQTLKTLDDLLATLRAELAAAREKANKQDASSTAESSREKKVPDYCAMQDTLDLTKARRLIHARECAINTTKILIEKCEKAT